MELALSETRLTITLENHERLWSAHVSKTIEVLLTHITHVETGVPDGLWDGIRAPGTFVPGVIRAGTYYTKRGREFWYVTRQDGPLDQAKALSLDLSQDEYYKRIVLSVQSCQSWGDRIQTATNHS